MAHTTVVAYLAVFTVATINTILAALAVPAVTAIDTVGAVAALNAVPTPMIGVVVRFILGERGRKLGINTVNAFVWAALKLFVAFKYLGCHALLQF